MMGFGFLFMLLVLAVPVVLIVALAIWLFNKSTQKSVNTLFSPAQPSATQLSERTCSHCGTQLQPNWSHCPQCGAPTE